MKLLLAAALAWAAGPVAPRAPLTPDIIEALTDHVFETEQVQAWSKDASETEIAAAKLQFAKWVTEHPGPASQIYGGFLIEVSPAHKQRFETLLREYAEYFSDPDRAVNRLEDAARTATAAAGDAGFDPEHYNELTRRAFEGKGAEGNPPAGLGGEVDAVDWAPRGAGPLQLNAAEYGRIRAEGEKRGAAEREALEADKRDATQLGLGAKLDSAFQERQRFAQKAEVAWRNFAGVLSKRPEALETGLTKDELRLLAHSRNEMYRWLAASALARAEHRFRRLRAQLDEASASERLLAGLPVSGPGRTAYARRLDALKTRLDAHLARSAAARKALEEDDYSVRLQDLRRLASENEREALALQAEIRSMMEAPRLLRRARRSDEELGWWDKLVRWFYTTVLPDSKEAARFRREAAAQAILLRQIEG